MLHESFPITLYIISTWLFNAEKILANFAIPRTHPSAIADKYGRSLCLDSVIISHLAFELISMSYVFQTINK